MVAEEIAQAVLDGLLRVGEKRRSAREVKLAYRRRRAESAGPDSDEDGNWPGQGFVEGESSYGEKGEQPGAGRRSKSLCPWAGHLFQ